MRRVDFELERVMNEAIDLLARTLNETGHNTKPVLLHSIRIGFDLYELDYPKNIVIAGILHDILEDTEMKVEKLERLFGEEITKLVYANSFDTEIKEKKKRYKDLFEKCNMSGKEALVIKAADIFDNSYYIQFVKDEKEVKFLLEKMKYFLELSKEKIEIEEVWKRLSKRYDELIK